MRATDHAPNAKSAPLPNAVRNRGAAANESEAAGGARAAGGAGAQETKNGRPFLWRKGRPLIGLALDCENQ
jgi:hypothetical protein